MKGIRRKLFGTRRRVIVSSIVGVFLLAGTAFAAWSVITSAGSGGGKIGQLAAPTIVAAASPTGDLVPDSANYTGSLQLQVTNPNAAALYLKSIATVDTQGSNYTFTGPGMSIAPCSGGWGSIAAYFSVNGASFPRNFPTGLMVDGSGTNGGVTNVTVPNVFKLTDDAPTCLQGVTIGNVAITDANFSTAP